MAENQFIGLLGKGGQADEVRSYLQGGQSVAFYGLSKDYLDPSDKQQIDVLQPGDRQDDLVVVAVGAPALKRKLIADWAGHSYATVLAQGAYIDETTSIGEGTVVAPGVVITTHTIIGQHVLINVGATINHDVVIGSYVTISPGAHVAGKVTLGDGVFIGIGASISNNVTIAPGCVIGAGAVVLESVSQENSVVVGVPGKVIHINEDWLSEI